MPRKLRYDEPGAVHHVYHRGNAKAVIYTSDSERAYFLETLRRIAVERRWTVYGYCLMTNHYHALIQTEGGDLSRGLHGLHGSYAMHFNAVHERVGHVFQGRYGCTPVLTDRQLLVTARYIVLNPVRASLCTRAADWRWGSAARIDGDTHPAVRAMDRDFGSAMGRFFAAGGDAHAWLRFVDDTAADATKEYRSVSDPKEQPHVSPARSGPSRAREPLFAILPGAKNASREQIAQAHLSFGHSQAAIAQHTGYTPARISQLVKQFRACGTIAPVTMDSGQTVDRCRWPGRAN